MPPFRLSLRTPNVPFLRNVFMAPTAIFRLLTATKVNLLRNRFIRNWPRAFEAAL